MRVMLYRLILALVDSLPTCHEGCSWEVLGFGSQVWTEWETIAMSFAERKHQMQGTYSGKEPAAMLM